MFSLAVLTDSVRVHPKNLQSSLLNAVMEVLNSRFCNRIIGEVGLGMSVYDVLEVEDPFVHPGESHAFIKGKTLTVDIKVRFYFLVCLFVVKFRLIVFKPFVGEVLIGKIRSCTEEGLSVSLSFFDDIFIPAHCLQPGSTFNTEERLWVWNYDGNELFMDLDEKIRFRVLAGSFAEVAPVQKEALLASVANKLSGTSALTEADQKLALESVPTVPPFKIIGSVAEDGLGLLTWWGVSE